MEDLTACKPWIGPIIVDNKEYHTINPEIVRDGNRVWSISVALAQYLSELNILGSSIELGCGCGCGLVGMVTGSTLLDKDLETLKLTSEILKLNNYDNRLINSSWVDVNESFDNIFGSEILYPAYEPSSIADFIGRNWTKKGKVILAASRSQFASLFETRLIEIGFSFKKEDRTYQSFNYTIWEINV